DGVHLLADDVGVLTDGADEELRLLEHRRAQLAVAVRGADAAERLLDVPPPHRAGGKGVLGTSWGLILHAAALGLPSPAPPIREPPAKRKATHCTAATGGVSNSERAGVCLVMRFAPHSRPAAGRTLSPRETRGVGSASLVGRCSPNLYRQTGLARRSP